MTSERSAGRPGRRLSGGLLALLLALGLAIRPLPAQESAADTTAGADPAGAGHPFWSRYTTATLGAVAIAGGTLAYSAGVWWVNDYRPFHYYQAPWVEGLGVDKIGHLYTSYAMFRSLHDVLLWGDHGREPAFWWAAGVSAFHGLAVEIGDGFSEYGFDYHDLAFNYMGLAYAIAQARIPVLENFDLKWSLYYPLNRHAFKVNGLYDYHIYWVSARVENLLPAAARPYWPDFLQIAFGLGADDNVTRRTYCLSFDFDLEKVPLEGREADLFKKLLNLIHLPAPGVKFSKGHPPEFQLLLLN